ncbi:MAG: thioredoxin domain-containing protein [Microbacteriaceae bacterium]
MPNRLTNAVSPYLRSHAENPVDWYEWGAEAFAQAQRRDVPVLISIGYSTCHWCHVMARESFSDPALAEYLNANFVAVKVDREEHPDVDASYLAAASAFTSQLGWPLNVFVTPQGRTFFAGTYFPPEAMGGHPAFQTVLAAVLDAWTHRRDEVEGNAAHIASALAQAGHRHGGELTTAFEPLVSALATHEDPEHGGFGSAPKFPVATVLGFLLDRGSLGDDVARELAHRTLVAMAASDLRDAVEGGFFRYATRADWTDPHYERMLYDNALLLDAYSRAGLTHVASGIADFLLDVLRQPSGAFASAQDSESVLRGERNEGGYYALSATERALHQPPALDEKILTGWNGLAIASLASAGFHLDRPEWIEAARQAADYVLAAHLDGDVLIRASLGARLSPARATLEDYGMFANGLVAVALTTGSVHYAVHARALVDACLTPEGFAVPGGADPVLAAHGLALESDPSEGAYPSGLSAMAEASRSLFLLTGNAPYRVAAEAALAPIASLAEANPVAFGAALSVMSAIDAGVTQLIVVTDAAPSPVTERARGYQRSGSLTAVVTAQQAEDFAAAGFALFDGRGTTPGVATAYVCTDFVCALPVTTAEEFGALLA